MRVPELRLGYRLDGVPPEAGRDAQSLCDVIVTRLADAAICLELFEAAMAQSPSDDPDAWEREREAERQREQELESITPPPSDPQEYFVGRSAISGQARRDIVRARWATEAPRAYLQRLPFVHARAFMTSLAQLERAMVELSSLDLAGSVIELRAATQQLEDQVPGLKAVRDSIEHAEDRARGRNRRRQPMKLAPVTNRMVNAPGGGVLIIDALNDRSYGSTVEDGTYVEVEVTGGTLTAVQAAVQRALDALPWHGGLTRWEPTR